MNSRQRRGVLLLLLSVVCALGAFAGVLSVISDVKSKVGPEVTAYERRRRVMAEELAACLALEAQLDLAVDEAFVGR